MTCTGNCLQGRACTCWRRDWADKRDYAPVRSARENWLAVVALALLFVAVAAGWL